MSHRINFERLNTLAFKVHGLTNFNEVTHFMDNRFKGLPAFHKSVDLKVNRFYKILQNQTDPIMVPKGVTALTSPHLLGDLNHLISFIQRDEGILSFGLIHLSVKLPLSLLNKEFNDKRVNLPRPLKRLFSYIGSKLKVPVVLAVASRKTDDSYESLAVGLSGMSRYCSALYVHPSRDKGYIVKGGLEVEVFSQHIRHNIGPLIFKTKNYLVPLDFFNGYLQRNLIPEKEKIVENLCKYVFHGCQLQAKRSSAISVEKIKA